VDDNDGRRRGGLIERADVAARLAAREAAAAVLAADRGAVATSKAAGSSPGGNGTHPTAPETAPEAGVIPFNPIRRRTAEHLTRSLATAAHTLVATEVDYTRVDAVRRRAGLTYLPFIARAVIDELHRYPHLNASVVGDGLRLHPHVNLGIAVDLDFEGLIVPVVHQAEQLRLPALAGRIADLAERARSRRLTPADVEGGTFTITNPGGYGTFVTGPIINQPQVAIVSTDGVRMRPVALADPDGGWQMTVRPIGNLSMSFDHRAVDGAYASAFLASIRDTLANRDWEADLT
jgi:pyruvate/2-oxoglutarate dehydrogenase complex dihydrolipoamide acyltransferase (E2) component